MNKILVVDDEAPIRRLIYRVVAVSGHYCMVCGDAAEARECLDEERFDLLLCDINLPGECGLDLLKSALRSHPNMVGLVVTGIDDLDVARNAFRLGASGYLVKPFGANELLTNLDMALHRDRDRNAHGQTPMMKMAMEKYRSCSSGNPFPELPQTKP